VIARTLGAEADVDALEHTSRDEAEQLLDGDGQIVGGLARCQQPARLAGLALARWRVVAPDERVRQLVR